MQPWDLNMTGANSPSSGSSCSSSNHNSGKNKKRPRDSKASSVTVVMTDLYNFQAKVHQFTGMPNPPAGRKSKESEKMSSLLLKPKAQRAVINAPLSTLPFLSSVLTNSTNSCNPTFTDHLLMLPLLESDHRVEAQKSNSLLLPAFSDNDTSNQKSSNTVSLLFEEFLEELERTENAACEMDVSLLKMLC